jgi:HTH-type transcriptional regulator/antitoxin HipB
MSDLKQYIDQRKKKDGKFAEGYDEGYEQFKIGVVLRQARESAGLTQEELAQRLKLRSAREKAGFTQDEIAQRLQTKKSAISRIENHAEDIKLSTLERVATVLGKRLLVSIS